MLTLALPPFLMLVLVATSLGPAQCKSNQSHTRQSLVPSWSIWEKNHWDLCQDPILQHLEPITNLTSDAQ